MRRPSVPLRVYLLLLVLGAMLPGAVLTAILVAQTFAGNRSVVERRLLDSARVDAAALDRELEATVRTLEVLATSPALQAGDLAAFHDEAERVRRTQRGWFSVLLLTADARQLMNTRLPLGTPLDVKVGTDIVYGVRPQHITLGETGVPARVLVVEPTGDAQEVLARVGDEDISVVVRDHALLEPDEVVKLVIDPAKVFIFDKATGLRLR